MKNTNVLLLTKTLRAFSVGFISIVLPLYLSSLGFSKVEVGVVFTLIIVSSATFTMLSHRFARFIGRRNSLMMFSFITALSSLGMFLISNSILFVIFALLSLISVNGTDIGPTFSLENAAFSDSAKGKNPRYFSIYNVIGGIAVAAGSLSVSWPGVYIKDFFFVLFLLFIKFGLTESYLGYIFFLANVLVILSYFFSYKLSQRIGLINTMVFTHLPSNIFLILIAFSPTAILAVIFYLIRMSLAEMDVPPRQAYTMMVIPNRYRNTRFKTLKNMH